MNKIKDCFGSDIICDENKDPKLLKVMDQAYYQYDNEHSVIIYVPPKMYKEALSCFRNGICPENSTIDLYPKSRMRLRKAIISCEAMAHIDIVYVINPNEIEDRVLNEIKMTPTKDGVLYHVYL